MKVNYPGEQEIRCLGASGVPPVGSDHPRVSRLECKIPLCSVDLNNIWIQDEKLSTPSSFPFFSLSLSARARVCVRDLAVLIKPTEESFRENPFF